MTAQEKQQSWVVELARDYDVVPADNYNIDMSGALVFTDGSPLFNPKLVVAYAPGEWLKVLPVPTECEHDGPCGDTEEAQ